MHTLKKYPKRAWGLAPDQDTFEHAFHPKLNTSSSSDHSRSIIPQIWETIATIARLLREVLSISDGACVLLKSSFSEKKMQESDSAETLIAEMQASHQ